jgi:serine protease Do
MRAQRTHALRQVALVACTLAGTGQPAWALTPPEVYAKVAPSIWRVATYDADGVPLAFGSGVVIAPETMVTNCHVLAKARRVAVRREQVTLEAKLELWDPPRDVCQIHVPKLDAPTVVLGQATTLVVGQSVFAIGNPKGLDLTMSAGLLSSIRRNDRSQIILLQTSAPISGGSSGGGLFDEQGRLIGLTTLGSVTGDAQNLNFAIPADWIRDLPARHALHAKPEPRDTSVAVASAPAATAVASPTATGTAPIAVAALDDLSRLPYASDRMRERYQLWLTRPFPRAFAISEGGSWFQSWGPAASQGNVAPAERALRGCAKQNTGRCFLYAEDGRVVYTGR